MIVSAFLSLAMTAPNRQLAFRRAVGMHVFLLTTLFLVLDRGSGPKSLTYVAYTILVMGIVEGAAMIGWRLTQMPKSQALEFLLVSPLQPRPVFFAEATVGILRFGLVSLSGLPILICMWVSGFIMGADVVALMLLPFTWGVLAGLGMTVWAYESRRIRRIGEWFMLGGILVYLVVGVLAGERLIHWLRALPPSVGLFIFNGFRDFHHYNPFGVFQSMFDPNGVPWIAWERMIIAQFIALGIIVLLGLRGAFRLKGHYHDRHYTPIDSSRTDQVSLIGDHPLSWWAVRRVMEYSGRSNLWLAGGFCTLYAAYMLAGDQWPAWMGKSVFQIFEKMGGAPTLVTGMMLLAAMPAAFQYGLWDSSTQDRCRRLELLLLTDLRGVDYWRAACAAAIRRGRGYFYVAVILWIALAVSGQATIQQVIASCAAGLMMWTFSFAIGFRAFASGVQANGLGSLLTLGLPFLTWALLRGNVPWLATILPPGSVYVALAYPLSWWWAIGPILIGGITLAITRVALSSCESNLRLWYDRNQGTKTMG